jgi:hypothetical protein
MTGQPGSPGGEVVVFATRDGSVCVDVRLDRDTVWLSLQQMADLFGRDKSVIGKHLRRIFDAGELVRGAVAARNAATAADGKTYQVEFFNLDAIISVGDRVNSVRGTQFRIWATQVLRQHLIRGFTLHERRLGVRIPSSPGGGVAARSDPARLAVPGATRAPHPTRRHRFPGAPP